VELQSDRAGLNSAGARWKYSMVLSPAVGKHIKVGPANARMFQSVVQRRMLNTLLYCITTGGEGCLGGKLWQVSSKGEMSFPSFVT
jgi:hypothetical protein